MLEQRPLSILTLPLPLMASVDHSTLCGPQVNVTLLDINDNHPTWKDAPYYINLVEMTPPDSDVTTVSTARQPCQGRCISTMTPPSLPCGLLGLLGVSF